MSNRGLDGWKPVFTCGEIYWEFYDDGDFLIRCTMAFRDKLLSKSKLPLKIITIDVDGLLTTC